MQVRDIFRSPPGHAHHCPSAIEAIITKCMNTTKKHESSDVMGYIVYRMARSGYTNVYKTKLSGIDISCTPSTGLQGLYSATNCADNILGRFTTIFQNQIARLDSFTNLTKR